MALFNFKAEYSATKTPTPRVITTQFGSGYRQITREGINNIDISWDVKFSNLTDAEADEIVAFLDDKGGAVPFEWESPDGLQRFTCVSYPRTYDDEDKNTISCTFERFFG